MSIKTASAILATSLFLVACSDDAELPESDEVTETRMDEVDVIDGTISDDMTNVDTASSEETDVAENEGSEEDSSDADSE
ncbi:hypothetical protein SAMN02745824_2240 [Parasphingorhabdus marina DSM 22363]|uniref:Uncharacterized protein n=1 Tax=Parasphingorhabdus marina DSM 22363 TaxID=1123272 RepID=A0A1N6F592_9SPHN|nr:hypothetical protein [Parasphingorhabdus marina]SIN90430.1 hypothetical protein SAMN02745824_2240 [Parasphingorhabdus marina DSM 22363]